MRDTLLGLAVCLLCGLLSGCGDDGEATVAPPLRLRVMTFNTGTSDGLPHDASPDDGYGSAQAVISDQWYGNGLAWRPVIDDARRFLEHVAPDIVALQEIFHSPDCAAIPEPFRSGWVCESWRPGDPTVAQTILGAGYQVACHLEKPDKCLAVKRSRGRFRGCDAALCLNGLDGARIDGCGGGSRVGRGIIELSGGGTLTVVSVHGTSGASNSDLNCRSRQFEQVFADLGIGDGQPAANGSRNLILGDLNTDPGRLALFDRSAQTLLEHAGDGKRFRFLTAVGPDAPPTYANAFNIDHILSDRLYGSCWAAGIDAGQPPVSATVYFDHRPLICDLEER